VSTLGKLFIVAAAGAVAYRYVARASASRSPEQADRRLRDDIQRHLVASFPGAEALEVVVNAGDVSLRGEMPAEQVDAALESVLALPGVRHVHNRVTPLDAGLPRSTIRDAMQPA
jgi:osmotically-inducible protein OsmY